MAKSPELAKLEQIVEHCEQRLQRASERCERAEQEEGEAIIALEQANRAVDDWKAANPDPQIALI